MMQASLSKKLQDRNIKAIIDSAGIAEKSPTPASDNAKIAMREKGLSVDAHVSKHVRDVDMSSFDTIIAVDQKTRDALVENGASAEKIIILNEQNGGVPNPYGGDITVYRTCADSINDLLEDFVSQAT